MGPILADPDTRALVPQYHARDAGRRPAKGVALDEGFVDERMAFADKNVPATMKASMANDLDRGNRLELDWLAGESAGSASELKVPTPVNDTIYAALKLHRLGTQKS